MFKELEALIQERAVTIQATFKDGKISLMIAPRKLKEDESPAYWAPFMVTGTVDELDAKLPEILPQYVTMRQEVTRSLDESLKLVEQQIKAAADAAKKKATEKLKKPGVTKSSTPVGEQEAEYEVTQETLF